MRSENYGMHYVLNEKGEPLAQPDVVRWAQWFEKSNRRVARTTVGPYEVSTIFLGLDHGWGCAVPVLWETMVFRGNSSDIEMDRCSGNREQAMAMHEKMVAKWKKETGK